MNDCAAYRTLDWGRGPSFRCPRARFHFGQHVWVPDGWRFALIRRYYAIERRLGLSA